MARAIHCRNLLLLPSTPVYSKSNVGLSLQQKFNIFIFNGVSSSSSVKYSVSKGDGYDPFFTQHHIPTSTLQTVLLAAGSGLMCILDPARDDMIATFGETTAQYALPYMRDVMLKHESGRQILSDRPRITTETVDIDALGHLPQHTFGKAYADFLDTNGISPDSRRPVQFIPDPELAYVMQRYREIHDLVHTLLAMPTNMLGEVAVKWVEARQMALPMCALAALVGPVRLGPRDSKKYVSTVLPWALRVGREAHPLITVYYEKLFNEPAEELRRSLNIATPPRVVRLQPRGDQEEGGTGAAG